MKDAISLLEEAGRSLPPVDGSDVDGDVARGRRALVRRSVRRSLVGSGLAVVVGVGAVAITRSPSSVTHNAARQTTATIAKSSPKVTTAVPTGEIELVDYVGAQPAGYTVGLIPSGWVLQGANNFTLVIAKPDDPDKSLDDFSGKLVVMLESIDETTTPPGVHVKVGDADGVVSHEDPTTAQLFFTDSAGHRVDIQAPSTLGWSDQQLADFGASVHVNDNAVAGRG